MIHLYSQEKGNQQTSPAFTASLKKTFKITKTNNRIKFDNVILNRGNSYDPKTGTFTAPKTGLYQLSVTIMSSINNSLGCGIMRNRKIFLFLYASKIHESSETANPVLELKQGDHIQIMCSESENVNGDNYSNFSGFYISK